jgi:DNA-binding GntR family transcriptional regulator
MSSKTSQAYRQIKILIEAGHLGAGQRVTEGQVADMVGMSRGPVRESLLRLEAEGLLRHKGSRRSRVVAYTEDQNPAEMLQRYELREQIESGAVRLASKNMTGWQIDRLMQLARQLDEIDQSHDRDARREAGEEFHRFLMANCGNPLFLEVWQRQRLAPTQPRAPKLEDMITAKVTEVCGEHGTLVEVVEAIACHDPDRAEALMKHRLHAVTEALRAIVWKMDGNGSSHSHTGGPHT